MEVIVRTSRGLLSINVETLEAAKLVATAFGFNLDLEPMVGSVRITATHSRTALTIGASGNDATEAAENLINLLIGT